MSVFTVYCKTKANFPLTQPCKPIPLHDHQILLEELDPLINKQAPQIDVNLDISTRRMSKAHPQGICNGLSSLPPAHTTARGRRHDRMTARSLGSLKVLPERLPERLPPLEHDLPPALAALRAHLRVELVSLPREPLRELHISTPPRVRRPC